MTERSKERNETERASLGFVRSLLLWTRHTYDEFKLDRVRLEIESINTQKGETATTKGGRGEREEKTMCT